MSLYRLSALFNQLTVSRCGPAASLITREVHQVPRDPTKVFRGGPKFYMGPEPLLSHPHNPINTDPAMRTTRDDVKIIYGPQHKLKRTGGRDPETGKKMYMCRGGGVDKQEREVMTHRVPEDVSGVLKFKVIQIQECEVRNSDLALIAGPSIEYIIQPEGLNVGDVVEASRTQLGSLNPGNCYPLRLMPVGMIVHAVESAPGNGSHFALNSGTSCEVLHHTATKDKTLIRHPSGISQWLESDCMATIGRVKQTSRAIEPLGSWKAARAKGRKPRRNRQRHKHWRKRILVHRMDQKWAKRTSRYFDDRPWGGQENFVPELFERYRYQFGDRKPQYFIRRLRDKDPKVMKLIDTRKFEPREEKLYHCSYEHLTHQKTDVMWEKRQRWRYWKVRKELANRR